MLQAWVTALKRLLGCFLLSSSASPGLTRLADGSEGAIGTGAGLIGTKFGGGAMFKSPRLVSVGSRGCYLGELDALR